MRIHKNVLTVKVILSIVYYIVEVLAYEVDPLLFCPETVKLNNVI